MIKRLALKNFGPYENSFIDLDDFTVVLGPNGAGKSVLFWALRAIGRVAKFPLRVDPRRSARLGGYPTRTGQVSFDDIVHRGDTSRTVVLSVAFETRDISGEYEVHLRSWQNAGGTLVAERLSVQPQGGQSLTVAAHADGSVDSGLSIPAPQLRTPRFVSIPMRLFQSRDPQEETLGRQIQEALWERVGIFRFDPTALKTPAEIGRTLSSTGYNFATYLDQIRNEPGGTAEFQALLARFRKVCPHVDDILLPSEQSGDRTEQSGDRTPHKRIAFVMSGTQKTIPGTLESDGTVLLLAYASLLHGSRAYDTICIEEPENGVHPKAIPALVKMLQELSKPYGDRPGAQVLICTHSRPVFDAIAVQRPKVFRLVRRGADGRSTVEAPGATLLPALPGWAGLT